MSELKPCPFCGGEANIQVSKRWPDGAEAAVDGYTAVCQNIDCIMGGNDEWWAETEAEAIDAWNSRAERTCENIGERCDFACSECGARLYTEMSDGYTMILGDEKTILLKPNYCPNCGRRVVNS